MISFVFGLFRLCCFFSTTLVDNVCSAQEAEEAAAAKAAKLEAHAAAHAAQAAAAAAAAEAESNMQNMAKSPSDFSCHSYELFVGQEKGNDDNNKEKMSIRSEGLESVSEMHQRQPSAPSAIASGTTASASKVRKVSAVSRQSPHLHHYQYPCHLHHKQSTSPPISQHPTHPYQCFPLSHPDPFVSPDPQFSLL